MSSHELNPTNIGSRLRVAREAGGMTQAEAASRIDVARTTLVAIEKGDRRVRTSEIQKLARVYGTSVNTILRREAVFVDLTPRFRKLNTNRDGACNAAAQLLEILVQAEVELETLLGVIRVFNYPPERPLMPGDVFVQAERDATELRQWLGLGLAPVRDVVSILELDIGVRVYVRPLDSKVSGLFAFDEVCGACMLLNANHPRERRNQTAVHELGHFASSRKKPTVMRVDGATKSREERYADAFGRAFLTPVRTVTQKFREITAGASLLTRRHVIVLAHYFGVSREAMVRRLEELCVTKRGTWDWFTEHAGITNQQALQVLGDLVVEPADQKDAFRPTTLRLNLLAAEAWRKELLSESQLARLLRLNPVQLRELLDDVEDERIMADGAPELPE